VLPEVGSTMSEPGLIRPAASSASIMLTPMRSLTLEIGLKNSSFRQMSAVIPSSALIFGMRTSGVLPIVSAMLS
jgi:hypothetical protein